MGRNLTNGGLLKGKNSILVNFGVFSITLIIALLLTEVIFRINGKYATFNEKYGLPYNSLFENDLKSWYFIYKPHEVASQTLNEYSYAIRANNEGFLDRDFVVTKNP